MLYLLFPSSIINHYHFDCFNSASKKSVNVLPPIEAGASCFSENSTSDTEASW